jgi:hypothetical protein
MNFKDARDLFKAVDSGEVQGNNRIYYNQETTQFFTKGKFSHYRVQCKLFICKFLMMLLPLSYNFCKKLNKYKIHHANASNYINTISSIHVPENSVITATHLKKIISEYGLDKIDYKILVS